MRPIAIYMIFRLSTAYGSSNDTVAHSIVLLDRMIAKASPLPDMVTTAVACFLLAAKMQETQHPSLQDLADLAFCTASQVRDAEINVLETLEWDINVALKPLSA